MPFDTRPVTRADSCAAAGGESPAPWRTKPSRYVPVDLRRGPRPERDARCRCGGRRPRAASPSTRRSCREIVSPDVIGAPLIETILSPDWRPIAAAADFGADAVDGRRRLAARGHEEPGEQDEREDDVRGRPGEDHEHALPGAGAPVRIGAERIADVGDALLDSRARLLRELLLAGERRRTRRVRRGPHRGRPSRASGAAGRPRRRAPAPPRSPGRRRGRRRRPPAGACRGSSRSRRAGSSRCRTRSRCGCA